MSSRQSKNLAQRYLAAISNGDDGSHKEVVDSVDDGNSIIHTKIKHVGNQEIPTNEEPNEENFKCASILPIPNSEHVELEPTQSRNGSTSPSRIRPIRPQDTSREPTPAAGDLEYQKRGVRKEKSPFIVDVSSGISGDYRAGNQPCQKEDSNLNQTKSAMYTQKRGIRSASPALTDVSDPLTDVVDNRAKIIGSEFQPLPRDQRHIQKTARAASPAEHDVPLKPFMARNQWKKHSTYHKEDSNLNQTKSAMYTQKRGIRSASPALTDVSDPLTDVVDNRAKIIGSEFQPLPRDQRHIQKTARAASPAEHDVPLKPWQKRKGKIAHDQGWIGRGSNQGLDEVPKASNPVRKLSISPVPPNMIPNVEDQAENDTVEDRMSSPQHKFASGRNRYDGSLGKMKEEEKQEIKAFGKVHLLTAAYGRTSTPINSCSVSIELDNGMSSPKSSRANGVSSIEESVKDDEMRSTGITTQRNSYQRGASSLEGQSKSEFLSVKSRLKSLNSLNQKGKDRQPCRSSPSLSPGRKSPPQINIEKSPSLSRKSGISGEQGNQKSGASGFSSANTLFHSHERSKKSMDNSNDDSNKSVTQNLDSDSGEKALNIVNTLVQEEASTQNSIKDRIRVFGQPKVFRTSIYHGAGTKEASWIKESHIGEGGRDKLHSNNETNQAEESYNIERKDNTALNDVTKPLPLGRPDETDQDTQSRMTTKSWKGRQKHNLVSRAETNLVVKHAGFVNIERKDNTALNDVTKPLPLCRLNETNQETQSRMTTNSWRGRQKNNLVSRAETNLVLKHAGSVGVDVQSTISNDIVDLVEKALPPAGIGFEQKLGSHSADEKEKDDEERNKTVSDRGVRDIRSRFEALTSKQAVEVNSKKIAPKNTNKRESSSRYSLVQDKNAKSPNSNKKAENIITATVKAVARSELLPARKKNANESSKESQPVNESDNYVTSGKNSDAQNIQLQTVSHSSSILDIANGNALGPAFQPTKVQAIKNEKPPISKERGALSSGGFQNLRSRFEAMSKGKNLTPNVEHASTRCVQASDSSQLQHGHTESSPKGLSPIKDRKSTANNPALAHSSDDTETTSLKNPWLERTQNTFINEPIQSSTPESFRPDNSPVQFADSPSYYTRSFPAQIMDESNHQSFTEKPRISAFSKYSSTTKYPKPSGSNIADSYQQRNGNSSPTNDIPWKETEPKNDIPWTDRELLEEREQSFVTQKVDVNFSYGAEYLDYSFEDEDCDGVTLCPTASDVSSLGIPSCIQSITASSAASDSSHTSDEDTGAMESVSEKQSTTLGPSEASSSQTSEAATPLIKSMRARFGLKSSSDTTGTISYNGAFNDLLATLPPPIDVEECDDNSDELVFKRSPTDVNSKLFEEQLDLQNQLKWKNDFFAVDSVKSLPTADSGDVSGWVAFSDSVGGNSIPRSVKAKKSLPSNKQTNAYEAVKSSPVDPTGRSFPAQQRSGQGSVQSRITSSSSVSSPSPKSSFSQNTKSIQSDAENKAPATKVIDSSTSDKLQQRAGAYRRFDVKKVRAFQEYRKRHSFSEGRM